MCFFRLPAWSREIMKPGDRLEYLSTYWLKVVTATTQLQKVFHIKLKKKLKKI